MKYLDKNSSVCRCGDQPCKIGCEFHNASSCNEIISVPSDALISLSSKHFPPSASCTDLMTRLRTSPLHFLFRRRRIKKTVWKGSVACVAIGALLYLQLTIGIFQRFFLERNFETEFSYPSNTDDFRGAVEACMGTNGARTDYPPALTNYSKISFLRSAEEIPANGSVGLLIVVKSATNNYKKRMSIRKTWGEPKYLKKQLVGPGLPTYLAFISGVSPQDENTPLDLFSAEKRFGDMVVADFHDCYENNTYKTVLAMRWAVENVQSFKYLMIVDDDMFINLTNAVRFLKNIPTTQVEVVVSRDSGVSAYYPVNLGKEVSHSVANITLSYKPIVMGNLIVDAKPFRSLLGLGSKWAMSIEDYPFNYFPPYIAGGATFIDRETVKRLYCGSFYTKHFWIDDVYIGIIAHKLGITLTDNSLMDSSYNMYYSKLPTTKFQYIIALHGLQCPEQLIELWHTHSLESLSNCYYLAGTL